MSIYTAMQTSWNSMRNSEKGISIAAKNIAHANDEEYTRITLNSSYNGTSGVEVIDVRRVIDTTLDEERINQNSKLEYFSTKTHFMDQIQSLLGKPEIIKESTFPANIGSAITKMFSKLSTLSSHTENLNARSSFVNQASILTTMLTDTKSALDHLSIQTNREIMYSVNSINEELQNLQKINSAIIVANKKTEDFATLETQKSSSLRNIAKHISITTVNKANGTVYVYTKDGKELLTTTPSTLKYDTAKSPNITINDYSEITITKNTFGKIGALYELKDSNIPSIMQEIDNLSAVLKNEFNKIYSECINFPVVRSITSGVMLNSSDSLDAEGSCEVVLLDHRGNQAKYVDGNKVKPLKISLANKPISEIIHEINQYFHVSPATLEVDGELRDMRLVARDLNDNKFSFDFLLDSINVLDSNLKVLDVQLSYNYNKSPTGEVILSDTLVSNSLNLNSTIKGNSVSITEFPITLNLLQLPTDVQNFNVVITLSVSGKKMEVKYALDKNHIEKGNLYWASKVIGNGSKINFTKDRSQLLRATLVQNGIVNNNKGFLEISTDVGGVAIKNIDSRSIKDSQSSFSHLLEFNNFFTEIEGHLSIKSEILNNPYEMCVAKFVNSSYDIGKGNNKGIMDLMNLSTKDVDFKQSGNLGDIRTTFFGYATDIIEDTAQIYAEMTAKAQQHTDFKALLEKKHSNISGVNIQEEIANTKVLEYLYGASKKVIEISDSLLYKLLDII